MLKELIDEAYVEKRKEREKTHFYVTDAGKCPRAVYFSLKDAPKEPLDARTLRIFENGDHTHMRLASALFSLGIVCAVEVSIPPDETIHGRADAIVRIDGTTYAVEFKSINRYAFENKLNAPQPEHLRQIQLYLHFFKIPKGILIYESKDTQDIKEFIVEYDKALVSETLAEFERLRGHVDSGIVPSKPSDIEPWRCEYCSYQKTCAKIDAAAPTTARAGPVPRVPNALNKAPVTARPLLVSAPYTKLSGPLKVGSRLSRPAASGKV